MWTLWPLSTARTLVFHDVLRKWSERKTVWFFQLYCFLLFFLSAREFCFCNVSCFRFEAQTEKPRWLLGRNATICHQICPSNTRVVSTEEKLSIHLPPAPLLLFPQSVSRGVNSTCSTHSSDPAHIWRLTLRQAKAGQTNPRELVCVFLHVCTHGCASVMTTVLSRRRFSSEALASQNMLTWVKIEKWHGRLSHNQTQWWQ